MSVFLFHFPTSRPISVPGKIALFVPTLITPENEKAGQESKRRLRVPVRRLSSDVCPNPLSSALFETLLELVNASAGINELLLAGEERMALGADVHAQFTVGVPLRRTGGHGFATRATNRYLFILRMDSLFHCFSPHSSVAHVL